MSSGGYSGITNGISGAQGSLEQMNAEFRTTKNKNSVSAKATIPIQKAGDLRYNRKKTEGYLLNKDYPQGGS